MSLLSKKIIGSTVFYSIGEIVPRILSFLLLPILTHHLSTKDYGITSYTTSVMTFIYVIAALSLNTFLLRNYYLEKSEHDKRNLIGTIFLFICLFNFALFLLELLFIPIAIKYLRINIPFHPYFLLASVNNFFDVISIIPLVVYRIKENPKGFVLLSLSRIILQSLLTFIFVVILNKGLLGSYLARFYVNIPFAFIYIYVIYKNGYFVLHWKKIKQALSFSIPLLPTSISFLVISLSDRIILERYIPLNLLGIYSVAFTLSLALNVIIQALYRTFEQIIFKQFNDEGFKLLNSKLYNIFSVLVLSGALAISLASQEIFKIVASKSFYEGHHLVPFMIVAVVIAGFNTYLSTLLIAANKQKLISILTVISAILCIMLNLILVPMFGVWGSIVATIISVAIITLFCCIKLKIYGLLQYYQVLSLIFIVAVPVFLNYHPLFLSTYLNILAKVIILILFLVSSILTLKIPIITKIHQLKLK